MKDTFIRFRIDVAGQHYWVDDIEKGFFGRYHYTLTNGLGYTGAFDPRYLTLSHGMKLKKQLPKNIKLFGVISYNEELEIL